MTNYQLLWKHGGVCVACMSYVVQTMRDILYHEVNEQKFNSARETLQFCSMVICLQ